MRRHLTTLTAGVILGAVVAGGIAYAAIPDSTTKQITACILKAGTNKGATRIIDAQRGATCKTTETRIQWAATGANWRGTWNAGTTYQTNDIAYHQGTSYRARRTNTGITPGTSNADWTYLARAGTTGPQGPPGADGADGQDATLQRPGHTGTAVDDPLAPVGSYTSVTIGTDGLPLFAHRDSTAQGLRVTHCDDLACTTATSTTVDDPANNVAVGTGVTVGTDGLPIISHQDSTAGALRVTHCNDVTCTTATSTTVDDPANAVGTGSTITIGADGLPIVAHRDSTAGALRVTHCDNVTCTTATSTTVDDPANLVGADAAIAVGIDGLPVISHLDFNVQGLRITRCDDVTCTSATSTTVDDSADDVGSYTSIAIGSDGLPVVSHQNATVNGLRVTHCSDVACTAGTSVTTDVPGGIAGTYTSVAIGADGLPIIGYWQGGNRLRTVHCANRLCLPHHRVD